MMLAAFAFPALAEQEVRTPADAEQIAGNAASDAGPPLVDNNMDSDRPTRRPGGRESSHNDDCERLVLAMDHLIAMLHEHEGPIPRLSEPVSDLNGAEVLVGGMIALNNLCNAEWTEVRHTEGNTRPSGNRASGHNHLPDDI